MKPFVISMSFVGANLIPPGLPKSRAGWTEVILSDGTELRLGELSPREAFVTLREVGIDCSEYSDRMDKWVATGTMPDASVLPGESKKPVSLGYYVKLLQPE